MNQTSQSRAQVMNQTSQSRAQVMNQTSQSRAQVMVGHQSLLPGGPGKNRGFPRFRCLMRRHGVYSLCIAIGCVVGVVLLVGTIVSVRKRIRSRRLARYQEMESTT